MIITSINLNGLELASGNYYFHISGLQDFEKDIVTNDLALDGESWERSKNKAKALVLEGYILSGGINAEWELNRVLAPNGLKTLIINNKYQSQVEVTSRGSNADNSHIVTVQLTMPSPYWYSIDQQKIQLGATYSSGIIFSPSNPIKLWGTDGIVFGAATGAAGTIVNYGNTDAYPDVIITGPCSGITLTNTTTYQTFSYSGTIPEGSMLNITFDPDNAVALIVGATLERIPIGNLLKCVPGNNVFAFARNSTQNIKHCEISLRSRWI
ncbi:hypothetical protein ACVS9P_02415 [Caproicibacterium sp. NSD3]